MEALVRPAPESSRRSAWGDRSRRSPLCAFSHSFLTGRFWKQDRAFSDAAYGHKILTPDADPEDILLRSAEKTTDAIKKGSFPQNGKVIFAWLRRVVLNTALDAYRRPQSRAGRNTEEPDSVPELESPGRSPESISQDRQIAERYDLCLSDLSERQRNAWLLHASGDSYRDIGEVLEIQPGTVAATIHRARKLLRACFEEHGFSTVFAGAAHAT